MEENCTGINQKLEKNDDSEPRIQKKSGISRSAEKASTSRPFGAYFLLRKKKKNRRTAEEGGEGGRGRTPPPVVSPAAASGRRNGFLIGSGFGQLGPDPIWTGRTCGQ